MKKIIATVLAAALCLMGLCAVAERNGDDMAFRGLGVTLHFPEAFREIRGTVVASMADELLDENGYYTGIIGVSLAYVAMPRTDYDALNNSDEVTEEQLEWFQNNYAPLLLLVGVREGADLSAVMDDPENLEEVAQAGGITWYHYPMGDMGGFEDADYTEEYARLTELLPEVLSLSEFYEPVDLVAEMQDKHIEFTTADLYGNPIDSTELFGQHAYTAVNIWASWCDFCVGELSDLDALDRDLADVDCAVVGVLSDSAKPGKLEKAIGILEEKGVEYTMLQAPEGLNDLFYVYGFPTTYIVDRDGNVVGEPIVGPDVEGIAERLAELTEG